MPMVPEWSDRPAVFRESIDEDGESGCGWLGTYRLFGANPNYDPPSSALHHSSRIGERMQSRLRAYGKPKPASRIRTASRAETALSSYG